MNPTKQPQTLPDLMERMVDDFAHWSETIQNGVFLTHSGQYFRVTDRTATTCRLERLILGDDYQLHRTARFTSMLVADLVSYELHPTPYVVSKSDKFYLWANRVVWLGIVPGMAALTAYGLYCLFF